MPSKRETALSALAAALLDTDAEVWRDTDLSRPVPPEGLIEVTEGDANTETVLSPLAYHIEQAAEIRVAVTADDEPARDLAMDALLSSISTLILANRTLSGTVDFAEIGPPSFEVLEADGAAKVALFTVTLSFVAVGSPLA